MPGIEKNIAATPIIGSGYANISGKVLVNAANGWDDYVMRLFEVQKGGHSGDHSHDFEHIVYVLEGQGTLRLGETIHPVEKGAFTVIPANIRHQLVNTSKSGEELKFICIVPKEGHSGF